MNKYTPVEISIFRSPNKEIKFDVFVRLSEGNFLQVFSKVSGIDYKRLTQYLQKGVTHFYILTTEKSFFDEYVKCTPEFVLNDPTVPQVKKVSLLLNMAEQNTIELFSLLKVSAEAASTSQKIIKNFVKLMSSNPKTLALLLKTASHGEYLYYHSISVSIVSMFLVKASGGSNQKMLELCGLGGFLHDIGQTQLPKEVTESPTALTPAQWREIRLHPKIGIRMLEGLTNIPDEVRFIVLQHHEEPDGTGYPNGLRGPVIFYPAKVVCLADAFCALITKRPFREAYTIEQAISIIQSEQGKFDKDLVQILKEIFIDRKIKVAA